MEFWYTKYQPFYDSFSVLLTHLNMFDILNRSGLEAKYKNKYNMKADKWSSKQTSNSVGNKYLVIRNVSKSLNYLVSYNWYDPILVRFELYIQYGCHVLTLFEDRIFI